MRWLKIAEIESQVKNGNHTIDFIVDSVTILKIKYNNKNKKMR